MLTVNPFPYRTVCSDTLENVNCESVKWSLYGAYVDIVLGHYDREVAVEMVRAGVHLLSQIRQQN